MIRLLLIFIIRSIYLVIVIGLRDIGVIEYEFIMGRDEICGFKRKCLIWKI
jgi:hypothetical protein